VTVTGASTGSRLAALAERAATAREATLERCELCGEPVAPEHRHLLDLERRELMCACRACAILFAAPAASAGHYRLVPDRRVRLPDLALDDAMWEELRLPVDIAFFFADSRQARVVAYYPSPMGPTESLLRLQAWEALAAANPILGTMEPDVEALLVNRVRGARQHWLVPIEDCYALVGLIRTRWRGLTGGAEVWRELARFLEELDGRAKESP
jgi:hypothetical protein